ncbi:MAG TPA: GNAT family N-acetyltransferase [Aliidongia sp.]|uniref:GNAT family N-acetyltransferase n=1 Tax=Aliidongia sp. TaxID=1914230 RepID=UPI002DDD7DE1|nr:GNAT family N-acetyltransferase [Aliidongia sp.]HEV2675065.1 GNAT family N-acetyltransferase [Aliidongia sp.]
MNEIAPPLRITRLALDAAPEAIAAARLLLGEYRDYARATAGPTFGMAKLEQQIAGLPASHVGPDEGLLIAWVGDAPAGSVVYRPLPEVLPERASELKRLWVRDAFRGQRIAEALVAAVATQTRSLGGTAVYLDTEPERMPAAVRLYRRLGFVECPLYRASDDEVTAFRLSLG